MKKTIAYGIAGVFAIAIANAGDKGVVEEAPIVVEEPLGGTISMGYMTDYVFYGVDLGGNAVWTGVDYAVAGTPLSIGVWYINPTDGLLDDELDVYASLALPEFAGFDASLTMTGYFFPDAGGDATYELGLGLGRSLGIVDWNGTVRYDFEIEGWYIETGISKGFAVADDIELVLSTGISYQHDYWSAGGDFNHVYAMASLPIALRSNVTLEPYIAGLFALDAIDNFQEDIVHGGVSLSVSF